MTDTLARIDGSVGHDRASEPPAKQLRRAERRMIAWQRVLDAVAEMRAAIDHRIWAENPDDVSLEHDCRNFCELALALSNYLKAKRAA